MRFRRLLLIGTIAAAIAPVLTATANAAGAPTGSYQEIFLEREAWSVVASGRPGWAYWNDSPTPPLAPVGRCFDIGGNCVGLGEAWSYFQFDTRVLDGKSVVEASFIATVEYSPKCETRPHTLHRVTDPLAPTMTWADRLQGPSVSEFFAPAVVPQSCGGPKLVVTYVPPQAIDPKKPAHTFYLRATNPFDDHAWRKYNPNSVLLRLLVRDSA